MMKRQKHRNFNDRLEPQRLPLYFRTLQGNNNSVSKPGSGKMDCVHVPPADIKGSTFIGEYLFELWKNQCLCDVRLQVGNCSFLVHKIVLAAFSEVFCPTSSNVPPAVCVEVPDTTPEALYQVLQYLYTSEMELTDNSLEPVIAAACFMGITDVVDMVKEILSNPVMDNLEHYINIRRRLCMPASLLDFMDLVREHFFEISETETFLNMPVEELGQLLEDPGVMVDSELDTLEALIKWLEFNPQERTPSAGFLLEKISLECIDPTELANIMEKKRDLFLDQRAQDVLMEAFKSLAINCRPDQGGPEFRGGPAPPNVPMPHSTFVNRQSAAPGDDGQGPLDLYDSASKGKSRDGIPEMWANESDDLDQTAGMQNTGPAMSQQGGRRKTFNELRTSFAAQRRKDTVKGVDTAPVPDAEAARRKNTLRQSRTTSIAPAENRQTQRLMSMRSKAASATTQTPLMSKRNTVQITTGNPRESVAHPTPTPRSTKTGLGFADQTWNKSCGDSLWSDDKDPPQRFSAVSTASSTGRCCNNSMSKNESCVSGNPSLSAFKQDCGYVKSGKSYVFGGNYKKSYAPISAGGNAMVQSKASSRPITSHLGSSSQRFRGEESAKDKYHKLCFNSDKPCK